MAGSDAQTGSWRGAAVTLAVVSIALLIVSLVRFSAGDDSESAAGVLPSVQLTGADDVIVSTDDLVGGPLVINFWYAACLPCANELHDFAAVHEEYGDRVRFVGINAIDTVEEMTDFASERGVSYELLQDRLAKLQTEMRLTSFPTTIFVASDGSIVARTGVLDEAGLEAAVLELVAAEA